MATPPVPQDPASRAFRRFRERGEPAALTEVFDLVGGELFALAAHLARDVGEAEDLVQETFLAALRGARRFDPLRPVTPWLVGVLVKAARKARRRRRPGPLEGDAAPAAAHGPHDALLAGEVRASVRDALARVPAPYREVLRPVLEDGARPAEVAAALGRAPGTVRAQLSRGLELLRRALPRALTPGAPGPGTLGPLAAPWVAAALSGGSARGATVAPHAPGAASGAHVSLGRGLAAVRAELERRAAVEGPALALTGAALVTPPLPWIGVVAMSTQAVAAAALVTVAAVAAFALLGARDVRPGELHVPVAEPRAARALEAPVEVAPAGRVAAAATGAAEVPAAPPAAPTPGAAPQRVVLRGEVRGTRPTPEGGLQLLVRAGVPARVLRTVALAGDGPLEVDLTEALGGAPPEERLTALLMGPGHLESVAIVEPVDQGRAGERTLHVELVAEPIVRTLRGRLVDEAGDAIGAPSLIEFEPAGTTRGLLTLVLPNTRAGRDGRFELALATAAAGRLVLAAQGLRAATADVAATQLGPVDLGDVVLARGATIAGTALARGGPLERGATVVARAPFAPATWYERALGLQARDGRVHHEVAQASVGDGGAFELVGLEPGFEYQLVVVPRRVGGRRVELASPALPGVAVTAPAAGVTVDADWAAVLVEVRAAGGPGPGATVQGATVQEPLAQDDPLRAVPEGLRPQAPARTDRGGLAAVLVAPDRATTLHVAAPAHRPREVTFDPRELAGEPGALRGPLVVTLEVGEPLGAIAWRFSGADGAPLSGAQAVLLLQGSDMGRGIQLGPAPLVDGVARFGAVPAGARTARPTLLFPQSVPLEELPYALTLFASRTLQVPPGAEVSVETALEDGGRVALSFLGRDPALPPPAVELVEDTGNVVLPQLLVADPRGHDTARAVTTDGPYFLDRALPPGSYTVRVRGPGYAPLALPVEVRPGETVRLTAPLAPATKSGSGE